MVARTAVDWMLRVIAHYGFTAAKDEETQVPLLLELQVEESTYVFEAKTSQRMELLVLSDLEWKMNPVTPLLFIDHISRRLGLKSHFRLEFLQRFKVCVLPSVHAGSYNGVSCYQRG